MDCQMEIIDFSEIKAKWQKKQWKPDDTFNLFIDSPFCAKVCDFCYFKSSQVPVYSDTYLKYYNEYLPMLIEQNRELLEMRRFDSVYFGGGTSSLMTADIMKNIFNLIPDFKNIKGKVFEAHPSFLTKNQMDLLKENKFTYINIGVQTFNKELTAMQNRLPLKEEKLIKDVSYLQSGENPVVVNCDILVFFSHDKDLEIFQADFKHMTEVVKPHTITIYPNYNDLSISPQETYQMILKLRRVLLKYNRRGLNYKVYHPLPISEESIMEKYQDCYFSSDMSHTDFQNTRVHDCSGYPFNPSNQNVIGLGGYNNRTPFSYIGKEFYYEIANMDWKAEYRTPCEDC